MIDTTPQLFELPKRRDRPHPRLSFWPIRSSTGNAHVKGGAPLKHANLLHCPRSSPACQCPKGLAIVCLSWTSEKFSKWVLEQKSLLLNPIRPAGCPTVAVGHAAANLRYAADSGRVCTAGARSSRGDEWRMQLFDTSKRFLKRAPGNAFRNAKAHSEQSLFTNDIASQHSPLEYTNYPRKRRAYLCQRTADAGIDVFRVSTRSTGSTTCAWPWKR